MIDNNGYPEEDFMRSLAAAKTTAELFGQAAAYFNAYNPGSAWQESGYWHFATCGWSGCEDVIELVMEHVFGRLCWESSHRGGKHVFEIREFAVK